VPYLKTQQPYEDESWSEISRSYFKSLQTKHAKVSAESRRVL